MSTNAIIQIDGSDIKLYKHWDGDPESTLEWLTNFHTDFVSKRGADTSYELAQLVRSSIRDAGEYNLDDSKYTGWGLITEDEPCDFLYTLKENGEVKVQENYRLTQGE